MRELCHKFIKHIFQQIQYVNGFIITPVTLSVRNGIYTNTENRQIIAASSALPAISPSVDNKLTLKLIV